MQVEVALDVNRQPHITVFGEVCPVGFVYRAYPDGDGTVYVGRNPDGWVQFMRHNPRNERGYGGTVRVLPMEDGTTRTIRGPWSSRAGVINRLIDEPVIEVTLVDANRGWHMACWALPICTLRDLHGVTFIRDTRGEDVTYTPEIR